MGTVARHAGLKGSGLAADEQASVLRLLCVIALVATDFGRAHFASITTTPCAPNGTLYAASYTALSATPYVDYQTTALADAASLTPGPTIGTPVYRTDSNADNSVQLAAR